MLTLEKGSNSFATCNDLTNKASHWIYINICVKAKAICSFHTKRDHEKFLTNCPLTSYAIVFGQGVFFSIIKRVFGQKQEFYLSYYNAIF